MIIDLKQVVALIALKIIAITLTFDAYASAQSFVLFHARSPNRNAARLGQLVRFESFYDSIAPSFWFNLDTTVDLWPVVRFWLSVGQTTETEATQNCDVIAMRYGP